MVKQSICFYSKETMRLSSSSRQKKGSHLKSVLILLEEHSVLVS